MKEPYVSVVVVTKNRAASLERALRALTSLDYPEYEVIVVDNGSSDRTPETARKYPVRYVRVEQSNIALARKQGVESSRGDIVAFCDDDCVPRQDWLKQLVRRLNHQGVALVAGTLVNVGWPTGVIKGRSRLGRNGVLTWASTYDEAEFFGNANIAFWKAAYETIGGYDEFYRAGYEEIDLVQRFRNAGFRVAHAPEAVVEHYYTGISYKLKPFYSGSLMRLYFYFKHFRPRTVKEWLGFLGYEFWLLAKELYGIARRLVRTGLRGEFRQWPRIGLHLFNSVSARLALPWLLWKAAQRSRLERSLWEKQ